MQVITTVQVANPGMTVTAFYLPYDYISNMYVTEVHAGRGPDMVILPNYELNYFTRVGVVRNLDFYLEGRLEQFYPSAVEGMKADGHLYGVPESAEAVALYYNKSRISTPPSTTSELMVAVQNGTKIVLPQNPYYLFGFWGAFGGQLMNDQGRCIADQGGFAPAMQYLVDLQNAGATFTTDLGIADSLFTTGAVDMIINGPWMLNDYRTVLTSNLGLALIPAGPTNPATPINSVDGFYINPNTQNFTSTAELALFMTNQSSSQIFTDIGGHIPIRSDVTSTDPLINAFAQSSAQGFSHRTETGFDSFWGPFYDMVNNVMAGNVSPTSGVMIACDTMNQLNGFSTFRTYLPLIRR